MDTTVQFNSFTQNEKQLFTQFRRKINTEAARAQIKKIEYNLADATAGTGVLKSACSDANALPLGGVCVLPGFVKSCATFLGTDRKCRLIACIGYPHGGDTTEIKVKAVKRAIKDGADEVEVTVPVARIREGNFAYVKRELKKLRSAAKKRALRVDLECSLLTKEEIARVCRIAVDCGVNSVKTSSGEYHGGSEAETLSAVQSAVKDKCLIKAEGVASIVEMSAAIDLGASVIGSKNAAEVARTILVAADTEEI